MALADTERVDGDGCAHMTHAAIEAVRQLRQRHGVVAGDVRLEVHVASMVLGVCNVREPTTGLAGKFSLRVTTALALLGDDTSDLGSYTDGKMTDETLVTLRDRIVVVPDDLAPTRARVVVDSGGTTIDAEADTRVPSADLPAQRDGLRRKFVGLAAPLVAAQRADRLAEGALHAEDVDGRLRDAGFHAASLISEDTVMEERKIRVLVAKPGLDGHDRGARVVAYGLRDAGLEVIYTGLRQTPEQIATAAVQEDVDVVGLSILSGAHIALTRRVLEELRKHDAGDIPVVVGGVVPDADKVALKDMGVAEVFTSGTPVATVAAFITSHASRA